MGYEFNSPTNISYFDHINGGGFQVKTSSSSNNLGNKSFENSQANLNLLISDLYIKSKKYLAIPEQPHESYLTQIQAYLHTAFEKNEKETIECFYNFSLENQTGVNSKYDSKKLTIAIDGSVAKRKNNFYTLTAVMSLFSPLDGFKLKINNLNLKKLQSFFEVSAKNIVHLKLFDCQARSINFEKFINLRNMNIFGGKKFGKNNGIGNLTNLLKLKLNQCDGWESLFPTKIEDHEAHNLKTQFLNLKKLTINEDNTLVNLKNLNYLVNLSILRVQFCSKLESIYLKDNNSLTDIEINYCLNLKESTIFDNINRLKKIKISNCPIRKPPLIQGNNNIQVVEIVSCIFLKSFPDLRLCSNLKKIKLFYCSSLNDQIVFDSFPNLNSVKIIDCQSLKKTPQIKGESVDIINLNGCTDLKRAPDVTLCPNLRTLKLNKTNIIYPPNTQGLNKLKTVDLRFCPNLDQTEANNYYYSSLPEHPDLKFKCEGLYICMNRVYDPEAKGYIYEVKQGQILLRDDKELFPAIQPLRVKGYVLGKLAKSIGYGQTSKTLLLPDVNVLNHRWNQVKPESIKLHFVSSEDVVSNETFIDIFLDDKLTISSTKEWVHDHTAHIINMIDIIEESLKKDILENQQPGTHFNHAMNRLQSEVRQINDFLNELEEYITHKPEDKKRCLLLKELRTCLAMSIDIATNTFPFLNFQQFSLKDVIEQSITPEHRWYKYFSKRFGEAEHKANIQFFSRAWSYIISGIEKPNLISPEDLMVVLSPE